MPQIDLYGQPNVPYTEKCLRGLRFKGLTYNFHTPEGPEEIRRVNPKTALLPAMRVDGELVVDSTNILLKLDEIQPDPPLLSRDPQVADQQLRLEDWADESFLFYFQRWMQHRAEQDAKPPGRGPKALRSLASWLRAGGTWERPHTAILRGIDDRLSDLNNFLGSRPFFYADAPSMADIAVHAMLVTMRQQVIQGTGPLLARQPALVAYMDRVEEVTAG